MAKTPNHDVLGGEMSLIFGKCRLSFFVAFKAKRAFFLAFLIFGRFYPIFASFLEKIIHFPTYFFPAGQVFWLFFHKKPIFLKQSDPGFIDFFSLFDAWRF